MTILQTESMTAHGGQTIRVLEEMQIIRDKGWNVYLATHPKSWLFNQAVKKGFKAFPINFFGPLDFLSTYKLFKIINEHNVDLIHSHSSKDGYPALYVSKITNIPSIRSKHIGLTKKPSITYNYYDGIITTGSKIIDEMRKANIENEFISIPTFPDKNKFFPDSKLRQYFRKRFNISDKETVIGTLSGTNRRKRPHFLLEFAQAHPKIKVLIAGQKFTNDYSKELLKKIEGISNIQYIGFQNPQEFLNGIDIFVCPSSNESTTQTIPQAMLCQKPVVTMDVGSISDLNKQNNLILCKSKDDFLQSLHLLSTDTNKQKELGLLNRNLALTFFHRSIMEKNLLDFYSKINSKKRRK